MTNVDFYITKVRYNSDNSHVAMLKAHPVGDNARFDVRRFEEMTRPQVIKLMKEGKRFATAVVKGDNYVKGAPLQIIEVSTEYLKTANDKSTKDNLESLPQF